MAIPVRIAQVGVESADVDGAVIRVASVGVELLDGSHAITRVAQHVVEIMFGPAGPPPTPPNPIPTLVASRYQWRLHRSDNRPRKEQTSGGGLA